MAERGRPTDYTEAQGDAICEWIATGNSLSSWCRDNDTALSTVYRWLRLHDDFSANYARAREDAADTLVDKLGEVATEEEDVQRAKLKCDNIKWVASRMKPKNWGDKIGLTDGDGGKLSVKIVSYYDKSGQKSAKSDQ